MCQEQNQSGSEQDVAGHSGSATVKGVVLGQGQAERCQTAWPMPSRERNWRGQPCRRVRQAITSRATPNSRKFDVRRKPAPSGCVPGAKLRAESGPNSSSRSMPRLRPKIHSARVSKPATLTMTAAVLATSLLATPSGRIILLYLSSHNGPRQVWYSLQRSGAVGVLSPQVRRGVMPSFHTDQLRDSDRDRKQAGGRPRQGCPAV